MAIRSKNAGNEKIFYVYIHKRNDNGNIFYVGKGHGYRSKSKSGRSKHWLNIVNKHGYTIEYVKTELTEDESFSLEIETIAQLRLSGIKLCNLSNGGDGPSGHIMSDEQKRILSKIHTGRKQTDEHAQKSRTAKIGKKQPRDAVEKTISLKRKKIINSDGEIFESASFAAREIKKRTGINASQGNISMAAKGIRNEAYGYTWSYDTSKIPEEFNEIPNAKKIINETTGAVFNSVQDARRWVHSIRGRANNQPISACARGESCSAYGYIWRYL